MNKFVATLALCAAGASAFTPSKSSPGVTRTAKVDAAAGAAVPAPTLNGWVPDESAFAWGLPGAVAPFEKGFDPAGLAEGATLNEMKRYREAEVTHGRVAMLAVVGFLVAESFHPLFGGSISGPAINHLTAVRLEVPNFFESLAFFIGLAEASRATYGWTPPSQVEGGSIGVGGEEDRNYLREEYYPGDISFDPLGLRPDNAEDFAKMQTKELQNGRLAMLASMGFIAQELVNGVPIVANLNA